MILLKLSFHFYYKLKNKEGAEQSTVLLLIVDMKKDFFLVPIFIVVVLIIIICFIMGLQYVASIIVSFEFLSFYGPIFLSLNVLAGFILLIPLSILLETIVNYTGFNKIGGIFIVHIIELSLFIFYMKITVPRMNIVKFYSDTEIIFYTIMYFGFLGIGTIGKMIEREDKQSQNTNK